LLDRATELLRLDVATVGWPEPAGIWRELYGLAGPIGTAMVIHDLLAYRRVPELRLPRDDFRAR
jgi:hypothetical protein